MAHARTEKIRAQAIALSCDPIYDVLPARPLRRGECEGGPRPCPLVGCPHNNYLDVRWDGTITYAFAREPWEVPPEESCVLDVVRDNPDGITLERTGQICGVTRERIRQVEVHFLTKMKRALKSLTDGWSK